MAIIRHTRRAPTATAWRDLDEPFGRLARMFDDSFFPDSGDTSGWAPPVSISETSDEMLLTAELPGLSEDDVTVELENNILTISGEKTDERNVEDEERQFHVWERRHGSFRRSFTIPRTVDSEEVTATYDNGLLTVRLPKAPEAKGRKITVSRN